MKSWVILSIGVAVAAVISAKPLSRLRKPEKNDKLKIVLSVAIVLAAAIFAYQPRRTLRAHRGGAQCTVKGAAAHVQAGAGYQPYVIPKDLSVGGGEEITAAVANVPEFPAVEPPYAIAAGVPDSTAVASVTSTVASGTTSVAPLTEVVVGGSLRLVGEF